MVRAQDQVLVGRMADGDAAALRELHERHTSVLLGIAYRITGDREDARETVQEVWLKAWRLAGRYQPQRGHVLSWLVFMARNSAIDRLRRNRVRGRVHEQANTMGAGEAGPTVWAAPGERRDWLDHHLAYLTAPERQALELAFFGGKTQEEIATDMQTPVGNVKNYLRRGLMKLRQVTAGREPGHTNSSSKAAR